MSGIAAGTTDAVATVVMRALLTTALLLATTTAMAQPQRSRPERGQTRDDTDERSLTADQIAHYARGYYPGIKACYFEFGRKSKTATGELAINLIVHRNGYVHDVKVDAPGVKGVHKRKLDDCVRLQVVGWHFPVRRDFTTAILPYYFLYLDIPGAGPQESCWNPRGCLTKPAKKELRR